MILNDQELKEAVQLWISWNSEGDKPLRVKSYYVNNDEQVQINFEQDETT